MWNSKVKFACSYSVTQKESTFITNQKHVLPKFFSSDYSPCCSIGAAFLQLRVQYIQAASLRSFFFFPYEGHLWESSIDAASTCSCLVPSVIFHGFRGWRIAATVMSKQTPIIFLSAAPEYNSPLRWHECNSSPLFRTAFWFAQGCDVVRAFFQGWVHILSVKAAEKQCRWSLKRSVGTFLCSSLHL